MRWWDDLSIINKNLIFIGILIVSACVFQIIIRTQMWSRAKDKLNDNWWLWILVAAYAVFVFYKILTYAAKDKSFFLYFISFVAINFGARWVYHTYRKQKYGFVDERRFAIRWTQIVQLAVVAFLLIMAFYHLARIPVSEGRNCSPADSAHWAACAQ
jgi:hypothetical protein